MSVLASIFLYLVAASIAVPIANRIGLGSVLGYLIAGVALGPALGLMDENAEDVMHFSEFGVVMMLFLIGLELRPRELWQMRGELLGLGGLQMLGSMAVISGGAIMFGLDWRTAIAIGMILALSSTAIVLQTLQERRLERTQGGRASFAVLLFQDIAVIPLLAVLPLLAIAGQSGHGTDAHATAAILDALPPWAQPLAILGAIGAIILAGRFCAYPIFRFIASGRSGEVFTAAALALVIGTSLLVSAVGLSPALGAFLAGVVLSGSEYRHQLESDIAPFKGLLLGIFFISVGAAVDFDLLMREPILIIGLAVAVIASKAAILALLGVLFRYHPRDRWLFALALPQAGEFGFVLIAVALTVGVLGAKVADILTLVIALTMFVTPALFIFFERVVQPRLKARVQSRDPDKITHEGPVVIAGVGRFGQVVNRLLRSEGVETVVLDEDARQLDTLRRFGVQAYYGDASRISLLEAAGIGKARVLIATLGDLDKQLRMIEDVRRLWPNVYIIARANDRNAAYRLLDAGAHHVVRELFAGSIEAGVDALKRLGTHPYRAERVARAFRKHDEESFDMLRAVWTADFSNNLDYVAISRARAEQLEEVMRADSIHGAENDDWALNAAERFDQEDDDNPT